MKNLTIRRAAPRDLPAIVALLADDELGAARETPGDLTPYREAFAAIDTDSHQIYAVAEHEGEIRGTLQLIFLPGLSHRGATRAQIEAVRVYNGERGKGLGSELVKWAVEEARKRGCRMVQLTSNASRTDAHRFYQRLGFTDSHVGFKLALDRD
ncbi:GNAT family N-acetyltransferase [Actinorugispora endophytica]|uniref:N-acetylglutamate synthase-like GNAT family acetyltransferase n=1 Tax=Actinorugispora endophytica TaxID=1605990 RepID=A0A4R6UTU2_9ACTN|nr:GNAT family N-acetyltransferase [Actinorugispora endophytica]TDQ48775.1 N-acetylglutamate synthase-like GNAT family acetyltransferase [Actinorugispora endophytica]